MSEALQAVHSAEPEGENDTQHDTLSKKATNFKTASIAYKATHDQDQDFGLVELCLIA